VGKTGKMRIKDTYPVLLAQRITRPDGTELFAAWCPFCTTYHVHGAGEGHRVAHCYRDDSPLREKGYILKETKNYGTEPKTIRAARHGRK
jgi:hypothetical protein